MPITGTIVHCPAYQCCTAVYQSSVVGRNTKPSTGHSGLWNTSNQRENNHTSTITTRGTHNASRTSRQGMAESFLCLGLYRCYRIALQRRREGTRGRTRIHNATTYTNTTTYRTANTHNGSGQ